MSTTYELDRDFEDAVLRRSHEIPVLVDFWAAWCGPCRMLGPVLEKLAGEAQDRWKLVKVDTERHPEVAQRYAIRSIPAVKLFVDGEAVAEFVGALPEPAIRQWLDQHLPGPGDGLYTEALRHLEEGRSEKARAALERVLELDPNHARARITLAQLRLRDDPEAAREILAPVADDLAEHHRAEHLLHLIRLVEWARGKADPPGGAGIDPEALELYRQGALAFAVDDPKLALEKWIEVIQRDRSVDDDGARRACLALFELLGEDHEVTREMRRRFSMALAV